MILSPQAQVTAPPSLAEVLEAAKEGAGLIGTLEVVSATPTTSVAADAVDADHTQLVETVIESLTAAAAPVAAATDEVRDDEVTRTPTASGNRTSALQKSLDEVLPMLLNEIADLERCVRRANEEADRAGRHLAQARRWVAKIVAAAEMTEEGAAVVRLSVPGQRASVELAAAVAAAEDDQDGPVARQGRW